MAEKLIIENRSGEPLNHVLMACASVVRYGRVSNGGKQYCYTTTFNRPAATVYSYLNKASDRLVVCDLEREVTDGQ